MVQGDRMRVFTVLLALLLPPTAKACEIALVLAVDVSGSVDLTEYRLQMGGLADALRDGAVSEALVRAEAQVMLLQWTGSSRQAVTVPWTQMRDFDATDAFAQAVETAPRRWRNFSTAIGEAIVVATAAFDAPEVKDCERRVIDVSGDGPSNEGTEPALARATAALRDVTVNALAIEASETGLVDYFRREVITGPGAFALRAADFEDYPDRIRAKLLREVTQQLAGVR